MTCYKRCYSQKEANTIVNSCKRNRNKNRNQRRGQTPMRSYYCEECGAYHLTSLKTFIEEESKDIGKYK